MSNVFCTICVPVGALSTVQAAIASLSESEGMFTVPCYYPSSVAPDYYVSSGSISEELHMILSGIPGVDCAFEDVQSAFSRLGISTSMAMPEE